MFTDNLARMMKTCGTASSLFAHAAPALSTRPSLRAWGESLLLLGVFLLIAGYLGLAAGLIKIAITDEWRPFMLTALIALVVPAFAEEIVFRVLLPPALTLFLPPFMGEVTERSEVDGGESERPRRVLAPFSIGGAGPALALGLFVLWHPLQVWLGLPLAQSLFLDPVFLLITALLGGACAVSYHRTGSIWPAVLMHWVVVLVWKGLTVPA